MQIITDLLEILPDGEVLDVRIGLHWIAVVVEVGGVQRCGLASTLRAGAETEHSKGSDVPQAGQLELYSGRELAGLAFSDQPTLASVGTAAINALLPRNPHLWREDNAEEVLARCGQDKRVALVGHFPFVPRLRPLVGDLQVLELLPREGDLPASAAPDILPHAEVVAITGMTLANHTLDGLLALCDPKAQVMVLGPSTPLSPVLFAHGINIISGAVVTAIEPVVHILSQGGNFRQIHRAGVRLVNMQKP
jgi:uncharacterized protein